MARYLIAADPLSTFLPPTDTTTLLAFELLRRGIEVDYLDLAQMDRRLPPLEYLSGLRVAQIESVQLDHKPVFQLAESRTESISKYSVVLQRKDPPVDEVFIGHCSAFSQAPSNILQINDPRWTWRLSEHELPMEFPEFSIPTRIAHTEIEFLAAVQRPTKEAVIKPRNTYSGWGIEFFSFRTAATVLKEYWQRWGSQAHGVIVQEYAPEIETIGDLRILIMNQKIIGCVLRRPKLGSRLANLHQGGSAHFWKVTPRQALACETVARELIKKGLYLIGLDFIGERISEINITCPSALRQINAVEGIQGERVIIDEIERLRGKR